MTSPPPPSDSNPFATRFVRPGAVPYVFPPGCDAAQLVAQLRAHSWWGQVVGRHGSGKSTLLATLLPHLTAADRHVEYVRVRPYEPGWPGDRQRWQQWTERTQVVVDGYEQLGWWQRWLLRRACRRQRAGLLVSVHRPRRFPVLWTTETSESLAQAVVAQLLPAAHRHRITPDDVRAAFAAHAGDLRETLFALYDVYEERAAITAAPAAE